MISQIYIKNYALISELNLSIEDGLTSITGETGAGKSILLGAIGLALGKRADLQVLKDKDKKCIIELTASLKGLNLVSFFKHHELDYLEETILRREILPSGRSRAFINDTPVKANTLNDLGGRLVDIHSQHDTLLLNSTAYQLELLDVMAKNGAVKEVYLKRYKDYQELIGKREHLIKTDTQENDVNYIEYLTHELESFNINEGEEVELEDKLKSLENAEEIQRNLSNSFLLLTTDQNGILDQIQNAIHDITSIASFSSKYDEILNRISSVKIELSDIVDELYHEVEQVTLDPKALKDSQERYNLLLTLFSKHKVNDSKDLLEKLSILNDQLDQIKNRDRVLGELAKQIEEAYVQLSVAAKELTESRNKIIPSLTKQVTQILKSLNFQDFSFKIELDVIENLGIEGSDKPRFLFSANKGSVETEISKIASGGELSRIMLSLKSILASTYRLPTIIFDEIDTGVSGETASKMASILKGMGSKMQVWSITHLPQIAAAGNHHLVVEKTSNKLETRTTIFKVEGDERVKIIAKMLSHSKPTNAAIENARDLISVS